MVPLLIESKPASRRSARLVSGLFLTVLQLALTCPLVYAQTDSDNPAGKSVQKTGESAVEKSGEWSIEKSSEKSDEQTSEKSDGKSDEKSVEKPDENSVDKAGPAEVTSTQQDSPADKASPTPPTPPAPGAGSTAAVPGKKALATGSLSGTVKRADNNHPVAGAHIAATKAGGGHLRHELETGADGEYSFAKLEAGVWHLSVGAKGLLAATRKVHIIANESRNVDVLLDDLESADVIKVSEPRKLVYAEKLRSATTIDRRLLEQYKSGNDLRQVVTSAPGVVPDSVGNLITRGEHNAVNYEIDGVVLPETGGTLNQSQFASPRSLQQVEVDVGGYQANDGGGPLGAVVRMKSLPIDAKPVFQFGEQIGGPLAGNLNYFASGALSQDPKSILHKVRVESSGQVVGTTLGIEAPVANFRRNGRWDMNYLSKVEFRPNEKNVFKVTLGINETGIQLPISGTSRAFGNGVHEHDRENFLICSYKRKFDKWLDEANLHVVNAFYSQTFRSKNAFDPYPIVNGDEPNLVSVSPHASRFNYAMSVQGDVRKKVKNQHNFQAGFLSEIRPVRTNYSGQYYNANLPATAQFQSLANSLIGFVLGAGFDPQTQALLLGSIPVNPLPYGGAISPYTLFPVGPQFNGGVGRYRGFRYLQSAYFQDTWHREHGFWNRLTVNAGVRADIYHGVFGDTIPVAAQMMQVPGVQVFDLGPFKKHAVTNAQVSGRFSGTFLLTKSTALHGSFAQLFQPPPVDVFSTPPIISEGPINGIYNGTVRPLQATRGHIVETGIEQQVGSRLAVRSNIYYKKLKNFGDSGVIFNTPIYNRLTLSGQEAYGIESRVDLKPSRGGSGFYGFLSNTVSWALLRGSKMVTGGVWEQSPDPNPADFPDHDRRLSTAAAVGYRSKSGLWALSEINILTGVKDGRDPAIFGPHPARTPVLTQIGLNAGYDVPDKVKDRNRAMPAGVAVRMQNLLNQRLPMNLGSPFQGTRYTLPLRVLTEMYWKL